MKPAYLGSCSKTDSGGWEIISWLIEPQTTKCLKNEAKHFSSRAVRGDWIGVSGLSPSSQERAGTLVPPTPSWQNVLGRVQSAACQHSATPNPISMVSESVPGIKMEEGKCNKDASKNKSSCRSGNPPKLHSLEEAFQEALESPSSVHSINGK